MEALDPVRRGELSKLIRERRVELGWNVWKLCEQAETELSREAESCPLASSEERELWRSVEITRHHVATLENCPAHPLSSAERRARLLGITLALGLDRALINRLAGGV